MYWRYLKSALKQRAYDWPIILVLTVLPLVMGALYGVMYQGFFQTGAGVLASNNDLSSIVKIISARLQLSSMGIMQLSVFSGLSYFLASAFAAHFINQRSVKHHHRLLSMGYQKKHIFLGEGISYFVVSFGICTGFHLIYMGYLQLYVGFSLLQWLWLGLGILAQSLVGTSYALMALGCFRSAKTFSLFHFLPAFILAFLGGAMFPVDQIASSGIYEFMPTYIMNQFYRVLFTLAEVPYAQLFWNLVPLSLFCVSFIAIGYSQFTLKEVAK